MKNIVAISGSLRKDSYNKKVLQEIKKIAGNKVDFEILDISEIPLFNEECEINNRPVIVDKLLKKIDKADLVIISTPEYNYSMSGALKNALDWFSRGETAAFINKKVAITSASISRFGGVRAQAHLREVLFSMEARTLRSPELFIANAFELFNNDDLTDERTLKQIKKYTESILEQI